MDDGKDVFDDPPGAEDYVFRDGLRYVKPYMFEHYAHVKNRWQGRTVVDLFCAEFKGRSREYYQAALAAGRLRVETPGSKNKARQPPSGPPTAEDTPLRNGQIVRHLVHRHEPPVLDVPIRVLATSETAVVVCKPASMPVHPTGQYRKNSVLGIFASQHGLAYGRLCPVHRLDRNVSGLLLFATGPAAANQLRLQIQAGSVVKEYVACVAGEFPDTVDAPLVVDAPLSYDFKTRRSVVSDGPDSKLAATAFRRLAVAQQGSAGPVVSLVACRPLTGRTHQIRAHLEHAGHPIVNDFAYGGPVLDAAPMGGAPGVIAPAPPAAEDDSARFAPRPRLEAAEPERLGGRHGEEADPLCVHCPWLAPQSHELELVPLRLHACRYAGQHWSFQAHLPEWATDRATWGGDGDGGDAMLPTSLWAQLPPEVVTRYHDAPHEDA